MKNLIIQLKNKYLHYYIEKEVEFENFNKFLYDDQHPLQRV